MVNANTLNELYVHQQLSTRNIGKILGLSHASVQDHLYKAGIVTRDRGAYTPQKRTYTLDLSPLRTLTYDGAYLLGVIFAEGSFGRNGSTGLKSYRVSITQKEAPSYLEQLAAVLDYNGPVYPVREKYARLSIVSRSWPDVLAPYGLSPGRKSNSMCWPNLPDRVFWDFLRGYFDGDGNSNLGRGRYMRVRFTSTSLAFLESLRSQLDSRGFVGSLYAKKVPATNSNPCWDLEYHRHFEAIDLAQALYAPGKMCLDWKRAKVLAEIERSHAARL
jgi:hypothetical protein